MPGSILDVFNGEAFTVESLTNVINRLPYVPTRIGDLGLFTSQGMTTTVAVVEAANGVLTLVPSVPRGSPPQPKSVDKGRLVALPATHLPQRGKIMADEVQGVRVLGSSDATAGAEAKMTLLQAKMKRDLDLTIEYHRMGAIKGQVLNADGSVLTDMYTNFGASLPTPVNSIPTATAAFGTDATKALKITNGFVGTIEDGLGGTVYDHIHAFCAPDFFQALLGNPFFVQSVNNYNILQGGVNPILGGDIRYKGITWGGITWEVYRGNVNVNGASTPFVEAGTAYLFPVGVPDMFQTWYAPADYMETVNTVGLPYYTKQAPMEMNKGVHVESQSNPLNINTRPDAVLKLTLS